MESKIEKYNDGKCKHQSEELKFTLDIIESDLGAYVSLDIIVYGENNIETNKNLKECLDKLIIHLNTIKDGL